MMLGVGLGFLAGSALGLFVGWLVGYSTGRMDKAEDQMTWKAKRSKRHD